MGLAPFPDGRRLLVLDYETGNLVVREIATGRTGPVTTEASWAAGSFAYGGEVSPDGHTISYLWADENETVSSLRTVEVDGTGPTVLRREDRCWINSHSWTSDGEHLLVVESCEGRRRVLVVSPTDGTVEREWDGELPGAGPSAVSPDGRYLVFGRRAAQDGDNQDIWLLDLEGAGATPLVEHPANDRLVGWFPDTEALLFLSDRDGTTDLWAVRVAEGVADGVPMLVRRNAGPLNPLGFTGDGTLFYSLYTRWFSTSVAPVDSTTGSVLWESGEGILGSNMPASWSPDGTRLAFVQEQEGPNGAGGPYTRPLHVRHLASGTEQALAEHIQARNQAWSPDGRFILMGGRDETVEREGYNGAIYVVEVETGEATPVLDVPQGTSWWAGIGAVWSGDGRSIIYSIYDQNVEEGRLVRRALDTGREYELYRDPLLTTRMLAVSADGRMLLFGVRSSNEGHASWIARGGRILLMDLADGHVRELHEIREPGDVSSLQWSPDQRHALFAKATEHGRTAFWRVPLTGGDAEELWALEKDHFSADIRLSPDGRQIACTTYHQELEIWVMENIGEALASIR
jgi:Tol biopolymer transport system component